MTGAQYYWTGFFTSLWLAGTIWLLGRIIIQVLRWRRAMRNQDAAVVAAYLYWSEMPGAIWEDRRKRLGDIQD